VTEYGKTSKTMDALERLKSEMAKYGDIEPKERHCSLADGVEQKDRERGHFVRGYELTGAALVCSDRRV
jgi:hypothetical protein